MLTEELDGQIVGLARLVTDPADRTTLGGRPQITVASDLHNNLLAVPALQRVARGTPLFFVGDLTDRGTPLEAQLTSGILHAGTRLVFVTGNHDSDSEAQELADDGAIVLTEHGRLLRGGRYGPMVVRVAGLRVAGYGDPFRRRRARGYVQQGTAARAVGRGAEPVRRVAGRAGGQGRRRHGPRAGTGGQGHRRAAPRSAVASDRAARRPHASSGHQHRPATSPCSTAGRSAPAARATSTRGRRSAWRG